MSADAFTRTPVAHPGDFVRAPWCQRRVARGCAQALAESVDWIGVGESVEGDGVNISLRADPANTLCGPLEVELSGEPLQLAEFGRTEEGGEISATGDCCLINPAHEPSRGVIERM